MYMIKYTLYLTDQQLKELRALAVERVSVAEHIRRAVDEYLKRIKDDNA